MLHIDSFFFNAPERTCLTNVVFTWVKLEISGVPLVTATEEAVMDEMTLHDAIRRSIFSLRKSSVHEMTPV